MRADESAPDAIQERVRCALARRRGLWGHEFMLETCCEHVHEQVVAKMNDDPAWARHLLRALEIRDLCGHDLRCVADNGCGMLLDWQLRIGAGLGRAQTRDHSHTS
jgi:hypothetical protein